MAHTMRLATLGPHYTRAALHPGCTTPGPTTRGPSPCYTLLPPLLALQAPGTTTGYKGVYMFKVADGSTWYRAALYKDGRHTLCTHMHMQMHCTCTAHALQCSAHAHALHCTHTAHALCTRSAHAHALLPGSGRALRTRCTCTRSAHAHAHAHALHTQCTRTAHALRMLCAGFAHALRMLFGAAKIAAHALAHALRMLCACFWEVLRMLLFGRIG